MKYYCKHCGKYLDRESNNKWIKSYCSETGRNVKIYRCDSVSAS